MKKRKPNPKKRENKTKNRTGAVGMTVVVMHMFKGNVMAL
jgi:hypothetical protein